MTVPNSLLGCINLYSVEHSSTRSEAHISLLLYCNGLRVTLRCYLCLTPPWVVAHPQVLQTKNIVQGRGPRVVLRVFTP